MCYRLPCILLMGLVFSGCPSHTLLSVKEQQRIQDDYKNKTFYLKQSFYAGPFFAYDDRFYISERAFDERVLIESIGGDPILTADPVGILPMGTRVAVSWVEFPTSSAISNRKLKSPRHFTWLALKPVRKETKKPFIMVFTNEFRSIKDFENALNNHLVTQDPRQEFAGAGPEILDAIDHKKVVKGMRAGALLRSRGHPDKVSRKAVDGVRVERWQYASGRIVVLKDDVVDSHEGFPALDLDLIVEPAVSENSSEPQDARENEADSQPVRPVSTE